MIGRRDLGQGQRLVVVAADPALEGDGQEGGDRRGRKEQDAEQAQEPRPSPPGAGHQANAQGQEAGAEVLARGHPNRSDDVDDGERANEQQRTREDVPAKR